MKRMRIAVAGCGSSRVGKDQILDLCPKAETLLDQISDWSQILTTRYGDVCMSRWYGDGIVVLGDAAHAMSRQLG